MPFPSRTPSRAAVGLLAAAAASCASTAAPPLRAPELATVVDYFAGDPIGGPLAPDAALAVVLAAADAIPVTARLILLADTSVVGDADSVAEHVRLIVGDAGTDPLAPSSLLSAGGRLAEGDAAVELARRASFAPPSRAAPTAEFEALVLPGVTTTLSAVQIETISLDQGPATRRLSLDLWRDPDDPAAVSLALQLEDVVEVVAEGADDGPSVERRSRREVVVLDVTLAEDGESLALVLPARFDPAGRMAFLAVVRRGAAPADGAEREALEERVAAARASVAESAQSGADRGRRLAVEERLRLRRLRIVDALAAPDTRRAALVELASGAGAPLAGEFALVADEWVLEDLAARLLAEEALLRSIAGEAAALAWRLEREALLLFTEAMTTRGLPPEYDALLLRAAGEAARLPGAIEDAVGAVQSVDAFYARMEAENLVALEDSSPAARVRAHDWLGARGVVVPDYDPLAEAGPRRAALRAWREAQAAASAASEEGRP